MIDKILKNLESGYVTTSKLSNSFYSLCSQDLQEKNLKKLFLNQEFKEYANDTVLSFGLIGSLQNHHTEYIQLISSFMKKNDRNFKVDSLVDFIFSLDENNIIPIMNKFLNNNALTSLIDTQKNLSGLETIYNYMIDKNLILANQLEQNFNIIAQSFQEELGDSVTLRKGSSGSFATLEDDGSLYYSGYMGGELSDIEAKRIFYAENPIIFHFENFNKNILDSFFSNNEINRSNLSEIVEHALIKGIYFNNQSAIKYLFINEKCLDIIQNSERLKKFIAYDDNLSKNKELAKNLLESLEQNMTNQSSLNTKNKNIL